MKRIDSSDSAIPVFEGSMISLKDSHYPKYHSASSNRKPNSERVGSGAVIWKRGEIDKKYKCSSCKKHLRIPIKLQCGHYACLLCVKELKRSSSSKCPICNVEFKEKNLKLDKELENEILKLEVYCTYSDNGCRWDGVYEELVEHLDGCSYVLIECNKGCGVIFLRKNAEEHEEECLESEIQCEFCDLVMTKREEPMHLYKCPEFKVPCPHECGKTEIKRGDLTKHLENNCPKHNIKCPFAESGCTFTSLRTEMMQHLKDSPGLHLNLTNKSATSQKQQMDKLIDIINEQTDRITKLSNEVAYLQRYCGAVYVWPIDNYSMKLQESKVGLKPTIFSSPFLTSRQGYKLVLSASLFGEGKAKGQFMSIYVAICKSEYDSILEWPFSHKILLTLIEPPHKITKHKAVNYVIKPNLCKENMSFLGRPTAERNTPFGVQKFVELSVLNDFITDDSIFIKVEILSENTVDSS